MLLDFEDYKFASDTQARLDAALCKLQKFNDQEVMWELQKEETSRELLELRIQAMWWSKNKKQFAEMEAETWKK